MKLIYQHRTLAGKSQESFQRVTFLTARPTRVTSTCPAKAPQPACHSQLSADCECAMSIEHRGLRMPEYAIEHLVGDFAIHNSCVAYGAKRHAGRLRTLASAQFVSLEGLAAIVHGFSEYRFAFVRMATVRAPSSATELRRLRRDCEWRGVGFALPITANNLCTDAPD